MDESEGILDEFKGWLEDPSESLSNTRVLIAYP